jgi:hypothetical protein
MALVVFTAFHAGAVVALFWGLLANAIVATQVVDDGTLVVMIVSMFAPSYVTTSFCKFQAVIRLLRHFIWWYGIHITGRRVRRHHNCRRSIQPTFRNQEYTPIRLDEYMASTVSRTLLPPSSRDLNI